jgi:hypothetical protein
MLCDHLKLIWICPSNVLSIGLVPSVRLQNQNIYDLTYLFSVLDHLLMCTTFILLIKLKVVVNILIIIGSNFECQQVCV